MACVLPALCLQVNLLKSFPLTFFLLPRGDFSASASVNLMCESVNYSGMELICGQCDRHLVVEAHEGIQWARCDQCEHEIFIGHLLDATLDVPPAHYNDEGEPFVAAAQRALQERLLVVCSSCQVKMRVTRRMAGQIVRCLSCNEDIQIPEIHDDMAVSQSEPLGQSIYMDELEGERQAERVASRRRQNEVVTRQRKKNTLITVLMVLVILAGLGRLIHRSMNKTEKPETPTETTTEDAIQDLDPIGTDLPSDSPPVAVPATNPATRPSTPQLAQATCRLTRGARSLFAHGTEFPASSGRMYCVLGVQLQAGGVPISIHTDDIQLKVRGRSYPSIGLPVAESAFPRRAQPATLSLPAGTSKTWQLLFEVPAVLASAEVTAGSLPMMPLKLRPFSKCEGKKTGRFEEVLPRRLKPLLTDPIMAAIQQAPGGPLSITKDGDKYQLRLPQAGVASEPFTITGGEAIITLVRGQQVLVATLRYLPPQGHLLILSLDKAPLHQIVFRNMDVRIVPGVRATQPGKTIRKAIPTRPAPAKPSNPGNIEFFGTSTK